MLHIPQLAPGRLVKTVWPIPRIAFDVVRGRCVQVCPMLVGKRAAPKILNIGMPRTGTSSLTQALVHLGFRTVHYPWSMSVIAGYAAATEVRFSVRDLERAFPGSKYILTVRDREPWLESCRKHFLRAAFGWNPFWSCDPSTWSSLYEKRTEEAESVLGGSSRLLVYGLCDGEGWEPLCKFLEVSKPDADFPWRNPSPPDNGRA